MDGWVGRRRVGLVAVYVGSCCVDGVGGVVCLI